MPLVALDQDGQRVDITKYKEPRQELSAMTFQCQACKVKMILKAGFIVRAHFAHMPGALCSYASHPESIEHLQAKEFLALRLKDWFAEYADAEPLLEVPIPEVKRIADIVFRFPGGWSIIHEVQLASITVRELKQRTEDYLRAGFDTFWWLGKTANTEINRSWCEQTFGFALSIDFLSGKRESVYHSGTVVGTSGLSDSLVSMDRRTD